MGVAFSQGTSVVLPLAGVPSPHHSSQRQSSSTTSSPPPPPSCTAEENSNNIQSNSSAPPANPTRSSLTGSQSGKPQHSTPNTPALTLAQQIQLSLKALSLDWAIVDREMDLITLRFAAALLTSRLRVQRHAGRGSAEGEEGLSSPSTIFHHASADYTNDAPAGLDATVVPSASATAIAAASASAAAAAASPTLINFAENHHDDDDVGPQELYVSAALRLAALQLGRDGLQRVIVALAFLANGGESREERRLRRNASLNTATSTTLNTNNNTVNSSGTNPIRRAESSLHEINHFQRGAGFTGSTSGAAGAGGGGGANSSTLYPAAGTAFNASGSTLHSLASSSSALAGRRFSTAPHPQQPQLQPPSTAGLGLSNVPSHNASADHLAYSSPVRGMTGAGNNNNNNSSSGGGFVPPSIRPPNSIRGGAGYGEEASYLLGSTSLYHGHRSVSPLSAVSGPAGHFFRARPAAEVEFSTEEHSYNNVLLTSMNARSTLLSPLRTGAHGELLYSNSSFTTLMSLSTNAGGTRLGGGNGNERRSHRSHNSSYANGDLYNASGAVRSPVSPFFHSTTQWVIPPAPLGGQAPAHGVGGGVISANSSMRNSLSSMASPPSAPDPRRRSASYSRRLMQPLSPYQISRLSAVGAAGVGLLSRPASEEANLNALTYQLPLAVGGGDGGLIGLDGYPSGYELASGLQLPQPLSASLRDGALQFLRPEAVLMALCSVFAHLHLSTDDVANLVTLLVVAALEVQMDAVMRRLVETGEEVAVESLRTPSMQQIRAAVADSLVVLLAPTYTKVRLTLCAAAGRMDPEASSASVVARLSSSGLERGPNSSSSNGGSPLHPQPQQQQHTTSLKSSALTAEYTATLIPVPPTAPSSHSPGTPARSSNNAATEDDSHHHNSANTKQGVVDAAAYINGVHEFFEVNVPLESTPTTWSATAAAATARAAAATRRFSSTQRGSGNRQQAVPPHQAITTKAAAAVYAHSSYSDSAAGPTSSGSMSRSDITEAVANLMSGLPNRADAGYTAPSQEEVRCASSFLMDVETAFVLHYAEVIVDGAETGSSPGSSSKRKSSSLATAAAGGSSMPSTPTQRLRQRSTGSLTKRGGPHSPSSPLTHASCGSTTATDTATSANGAATTTPVTAKNYPWRRRSDADPDLFVQLASNTTVWPLRTRLLVRRHEYAYVYDAMASTMALLREENLYASDGVASTAGAPSTTAAAASAASTESRVPHPHTPIALIDLNKAAAERGSGSDLQVLSGPGDVEVVSLMPSRVSRNSLANHPSSSSTANSNTSSHHQRRVSTGVSGATASASQLSTPNSASFSTSPIDSGSAVRGGSTNNNNNNGRNPSCFDDLLSYCWSDAYQQDTEVYRMKGSTGTMYLLTVPAEADRVMVPIAASTPTNSPSRPAPDGSSAAAAATAAPTEDVIRASVIRSFERNRLVRPAVLSLASTATTAAGKDGGHRTHSSHNNSSSSGTTAAGGSEDAAGHHHHSGANGGSSSVRAAGAAGKGPRVQCAYNDGNSEVLALELGSEPTRIAAYPLRLIYQGVLHHFFFPNPSARDHWYQQLLQLSWMTQSRHYLEAVAAAPHDVERFVRNRISFPTGPGAFECLDMLGAGTFGRVLLVQHKLSKRLFAMKVIRKSGFHGIRNIIEARREKKILDQLDCPYIMKIHSSFQTDSRVYLLFDYLPGAELLLHTQSAQSNHFDETTSRFYIAELAIAVEYLRVRGIVHRDIKGDNLVLDAEGHVVLTDFGFAKNIMAPSLADPAAPPEVVRQHTSCGTLAYIAPEVLSNSRRRSGYGLAVDWWSLGVVLFTFLTGYFPFLKQTGPETSQAIVSSPLQFPPRPALSEDARSLLDQLLQKDPEKRIHCLADLRHHRFFEGFDWTACRERRLPPPLVLHKDSYRSPRTTADARQLLQDRVRRSLAWSTGQSDVPYVAPSHSRRSASDKLAMKHQPQLEEEQAELKLVEQAYGAACMPKPLSSANDVFGPLFELQERCGSDRDESDLDELQMEDYVADLSRPTLEALKKLKELDASQELCSSFSDMSLASVGNEHGGASAGEERSAHSSGGAPGVLGGGGGSSSRPGRHAAMPTLPVLINFSEDLYCDIALAKYNP